MPYTNQQTIAGPGGGGNPFGAVSAAFAPIYSMFGPSGGGGGGGLSSDMRGGLNMFGSTPSGGNQGGPAGPFGISPLTNPDNNLTGAWYNMFNVAGPEAMNLLTGGQNMINLGTGVVGEGLGVGEAGLGVTGGGLGLYEQPTALTSGLLSGDPSLTSQAIGPQALNAQKIMQGAMTNTAQGGPMGGARAATMAGLPQALAAQQGTMAESLLPWAAQTQAGFGKDIAGIGQGISATGQGMAGTGLGLQQTGTTLTGQGMQGIQNLIADILQKMGINYQYGGPQTFATIAGGIGNLLAGGGKLAEGIAQT